MSHPLSFAEIGIDTKGRTHGDVMTICPRCSADRKKQNKPSLSVNVEKKVWNCHHCGWTGGLSTPEFVEKQKTYQIPSYNNTPLSDKTLAWFEKRGISKSTILKFKITESQMNGKNWINFNYFRDEQIVNIKFRDAAKNFQSAPGAEIVFYNLDGVKEHEYCIITEGEMDALSVYEATSKPVTSVPTGASQPGQKQKLQCLDNCWQYFENKKYIIIATDVDSPGLALREELARRLGKHRCMYVTYPEDCKDINDVLVKHGASGVNAVFSQLHPFPVEGVLTVEDFSHEIDYIYENGYPKGDNIGFFNFDTLLTFRRGEITMVTGIPNSGKSEFLDEICHRLACFHGWKFGIFSAENQPCAIHFAKIAERYHGKKLHCTNRVYQMTGAELAEAKAFVNTNYFFINLNEQTLTLEALLEKATELVLRKGISGFVIDPWNYIEHQIPKGMSETAYISNALSAISMCAKRNNIHIFIVAHPTKLQKDKKTGEYEIPTLYSISGSAHFFNKTDNGICVYRNYEPDSVDVYVQKVRFKWIGKKGRASFSYDYLTGRYKEL